MSDVVMPSVIEFYKTKSLTGGRIETSLHLFMLDLDVFENICLAFLRGETDIVECRYGTTIKHPKDKYDKVIAKQEAYKKLKKQKLIILNINISKDRTVLTLVNGLIIVRSNNKIIVKA